MSKASNSLFNLSAENLEKVIKKPIVDVIITSPPYADLKNYGASGQIGFGQDYKTEYLPSLQNIFLQCFNVTKHTGSLWVVVDTFKKRGEVQLLPFELAVICKQAGWTLTDIVIWDKGKTLPWSHKGRFRNLFEYILFFTKSHDHKYFVERIKDSDDLKEWWVKYPERYSLGGKNPSNLWRIPIPVQGSWASNNMRHFCPFPSELVERILLLTTDAGDVVLDPFAGSGIVLAQALYMKRKYIGFEINPEYVNTFKKNVLPAMHKQRKKTKNEMMKVKKRNKDFEEKIRFLRTLKYPKSIIKKLLQKEPALQDSIIAIFVEALNKKPTKSNKFIHAKVIFMMNRPNEIEKAQDLLNSIITKPPISKFGIDADINFKLVSSLLFINKKSTSNKQPLYIYYGGKTHYYEEETTYLEIATKLMSDGFKTMFKNGCPPIISTFGIRQEIVRTWQPKNVNNKF